MWFCLSGVWQTGTTLSDEIKRNIVNPVRGESDQHEGKKYWDIKGFNLSDEFAIHVLLKCNKSHILKTEYVHF